MVKVKKNLTNMKFNKLLVLYQTEDYVQPNGKHKAQYYCLCDCGNKVIVRGDNLKNGSIKSCGCYNIEQARINGKSKKKYNTYNLDGEYGIGYDCNGVEFYFNLEDFDKIKDYCWRKNHLGYIVAPNQDNERILMHRLIINCPNTMVVDHINHNKSDNRKNNLRICTNQQNSFNRKSSPNNTSGVIGVFWNKTRHKWVAHITINNKKISLGYYKNINDAITARLKAEQKYFGEYAPQKYLFDQYDIINN